MMRFYCCTLAMVTLVTALSGTASAQTKFEIVEPIAGACAVRITVPTATAAVRELRLDDKPLPLDKMTRSGDLDVIVPLRGPLQQGDRLQAFLQSGDASPSVRTARGVNRDTPCETPAKKPADDRQVFELLGFLGVAVDNFAPTFAVGYPDTADLSRNRRTFGILTQYRLFGDAGGRQQLWFDGATLNGVRTADINCKDDQAVLCTNGRPDTNLSLKNVQDAGVQVIEHASTLEAHLGLRYEFFTLQPTASTPAKIYGFYRYGFIGLVDPDVVCAKRGDVPPTAEIKVNAACVATTQTPAGPAQATLIGGQPTAFTAHYMGFGFTVPAGPFRNTGATWGWGKEEIFTNADHWRRRLNALAIVDVVPQMGDVPGRWSSTVRFFVALNVDRAWGGRENGPDSIQTYLGLAFDLGRMFHP